MPTTRVVRGPYSQLIFFDTLLKKKPSLIVRKMLSLNVVAYRAPKPDTENITAIDLESDDDATLVSGLHPLPPLITELDHYETFTKETNEQLPPVMLEKKICHYRSDDSAQQISSHDAPSIEEASGTSHPCPIKFWSPRNEIIFDSSFEIVKEDDRIVYATALGPPPWHRPKESILVYELADPDDEVQLEYPTSGEPIRDFAW